LSTVKSIPNVTLTEIQGILRQNSKVESAVLYGSHAKGIAKPTSDIDLAIKGTRLDRFDIANLLLAFDDSNIISEIDLQNYQEIKNNLLKDHIDRVGIEIYKTSST
jgi:predicted nucleotidyltransferase